MSSEDRALVPGDSKVVVGPGLRSKTAVGHRFFVIMASIIAVIVFTGFAPSFYLRAAFQPDGNLSILLHIKGRYSVPGSSYFWSRRF